MVINVSFLFGALGSPYRDLTAALISAFRLASSIARLLTTARLDADILGFVLG
jgi:hypothetical protein